MLMRGNALPALPGRQGTFATLALALLLAAAVLLLTLGRLYSSSSPISNSHALDFGRLPLSFEPNAGQTDPTVRFMVHASGGTLYFTPSQVVMSLGGNESTQKGFSDAVGLGLPASPASAEQAAAGVVRLSFIGANRDPRISGGTSLPGKVNYFLGNDPAQWHTNLPTYGNIVYNGLYPGVDLSYSGNGGQLEGTYTVAAGADPAHIQWRYANVAGLSVDALGNLQISTASTAKSAADTLTERAPVAWQQIDGSRVEVSARYTVSKDGSIGITLGTYDKAHALVIDPVLTYSSYLGGSGSDTGYGVAVDPNGNIYLTGETASVNFPVHNAFQPVLHGSTDGFVTKLDATGSALVYSTYLGGGGNDNGVRVVADQSGNAYVVGATTSSNFPTNNAIQPSFGGGTYDAFVTKLDATGSALVYSTYLGGNDADYGDGIAIDSSGNAYVVGEAASANFPTLNALQPSLNGPIDAFVSKINPAGSAFVYSTFFGGSAYDEGFGIAVDTARNVYLTGATTSFNLPTLNPVQPSYGGGQYDSFLTKMNASGTGLVYSTYMGGNNIDAGWGLAVDALGNAYLAGYTNSSNFPTHNAIQPNNRGGFDMSVSKFTPAGSALVYSTYLGGSGDDVGSVRLVDLAINQLGAAYVAGATYSTDFPTVNPLQPSNAGGSDGFVTKLNPAGSAWEYSTYLGGSGDDLAFGIVDGGSGSVYVAGTTSSSNFPTMNAYQPASGGGRDAFVARIADKSGATTPTRVSTRTPARTTTPAHGTPTRTPTACGPCDLSILAVTSSCNLDGTVHWIAIVHNPDACVIRAAWRAELQVREFGVFHAVRIQFATNNFPPGDSVLDGTFCFRFSADTTAVRVEYVFEGQKATGGNGGPNTPVHERAGDPNSHSDTPDSGVPTTSGNSGSNNQHLCPDRRASSPMEPCMRVVECNAPPSPIPTTLPSPIPTSAPPLLPTK
jgi:hypothetical protein